MLPGGHRLRRSGDFTQTTRRGQRIPRTHVVVHLAPGPGTDPARVGFTVGRTVGGSVERHRVVRLLREAVRPLLVDLPPGCTLVVRALPAAAEASVQTLRAEIRDALAKAR